MLVSAEPFTLMVMLVPSMVIFWVDLSVRVLHEDGDAVLLVHFDLADEGAHGRLPFEPLRMAGDSSLLLLHLEHSAPSRSLSVMVSFSWVRLSRKSGLPSS